MLVLTGCGTAPSGPAPKLANPPGVVVDALEKAARADANAAQWVGGLDRFYQKQDAAAK